MRRDAALRSAISLVSMPSQVRTMRAAPLPEGTVLLLSVAAGDAAALDEAVELSGRAPEAVRSAAAFYIEQILLGPQSDSYRVLGAQPTAAANELRTHMALLMRWLHPDLDGNSEQTVFARRVTRAWEDLKTAERRETYDAGLKGTAQRQSSGGQMNGGSKRAGTDAARSAMNGTKHAGKRAPRPIVRLKAPSALHKLVRRAMARLLNRQKPLQ
ncbi:MAG: DnaJ domain-containing protein [Hyphomicrobium sp.]